MNVLLGLFLHLMHPPATTLQTPRKHCSCLWSSTDVSANAVSNANAHRFKALIPKKIWKNPNQMYKVLFFVPRDIVSYGKCL